MSEEQTTGHCRKGRKEGGGWGQSPGASAAGQRQGAYGVPRSGCHGAVTGSGLFPKMAHRCERMDPQRASPEQGCCVDGSQGIQGKAGGSATCRDLGEFRN